ncbi:DUF2790 domain-containing protein [Azomonas macrocytogenes]|uniref:DUF2790 domain-containing protein n=1 Tax=Azomonas macrocytogenes TaxID=69962 RepID=A0A839T775_AZOMA|nr:DUF2790 domain-containing protein [Azomonas macrocytogenes]MBB3105357.1 hypothetical protein [Azomonas macrocytogenes]
MKKAILIATLACLPGLALATTPSAQDEFEKDMNLKQYTYGMKLDIKRVVYISDRPHSCRVEPMTMVYEDSKNEQHTLEYLAMGSNCNG